MRTVFTIPSLLAAELSIVIRSRPLPPVETWNKRATCATLVATMDMRRERALKVVLVVVGLIFSALVYPLIMFAQQEPALAMMLSLYVTLGVFLLLAARNPSANRSLIAFTAWSSFAHAGVMGTQVFRRVVQPGELWGVAALVIIGVALLALAPAKP
jgi:uncharacterized membrane protein